MNIEDELDCLMAQFPTDSMTSLRGLAAQRIARATQAPVPATPHLETEPCTSEPQ